MGVVHAAVGFRQWLPDGSDTRPRNLRVNYILPSADLIVTGGGVFWREAADPLFRLVSTDNGVYRSSARVVGFRTQMRKPKWICTLSKQQ